MLLGEIRAAGGMKKELIHSVTMDIEKAYTHWSATYDVDRNLTRDLDQAVTRETLAHLRCTSVLEIGCGTGKNTALLAAIGQKVLALDFSEGMIERARKKLSPDNVIFAVADITRKWPCEDQSVDLIVCNLVLEHIKNLSWVFSEAFRVLALGGHFFISELHPFRQYEGTRAHFQRDQQRTEIQAFVHHISDFTGTAVGKGLSLENIREWWHKEDENKPPRIVSLLFKKPA
jgi:ubiquinone/menaquinone biosynthesis C-methylase UbiE